MEKADGNSGYTGKSRESENIGKQYEDLKKSVEKRQEMGNQRDISWSKLLAEDDGDEEAALGNVPSNDIQMKDVEGEDEELDSDKESRICAEFMMRSAGPRRHIVQEPEDGGMDVF